MIMLRDLIAAEERLEAAEREYRRYTENPAEWVATYESVDKAGKRSLNIGQGHLDRHARLLGDVEGERRALLALRQRFIEGG